MAAGVYLHDIPLDEARAHLQAALEAAGLWGILATETIPLDERALGRVLAEPVWAKLSSPHYHASAMDGFAVRAAGTIGAAPNRPTLLLTQPPSLQAAYLDTGDPLPAWADAVIPIENVEPLDEYDRPACDPRYPYAIRIRAAVTPWGHVRLLGEDIVATQLVLPGGHILRPVDLGAIAACGHDCVMVSCRPRVAIIPTGSELKAIGQPVQAGEIIEYNSLVLAAQINTWGGEAQRFPITPDSFDAICRQVQRATVDHDLILLNAGSSAGSEDFSARVVERLGRLFVHGVAVRPGHPVIVGMLPRCKVGIDQADSISSSGPSPAVPILGVPGYPVSAALTAEIFVEPLLARWLGRPPGEPDAIPATLVRKLTSPPGDDDYVRMAVGQVGGRTLAVPMARGAGVITSLVRADGIAILPRGTQGLPAGAEVTVRLYRSRCELGRTILAVGSHDISLDVMAQFLAERGRRLVSANVGSQAGLVALRRGESHLAGSHLLDPLTGEYNLAAIGEYLSGVALVVIALAERQQGLLVKRGNPKCIRTPGDLARPDIVFVNRQRGAGTRVLLDYHLNLWGVAPQGVRGYNQEEFTHLAVAAAVSSGRADCGLGIAAAAKALELDFVPLFRERYDLVIPRQHLLDPLLAPLLDLLLDKNFQRVIAAMPGYDVSLMGKQIAALE
ncbi:MAG: molybdopterin biosynthesis protein [Chloroflexota bacterium]